MTGSAILRQFGAQSRTIGSSLSPGFGERVSNEDPTWPRTTPGNAFPSAFPPGLTVLAGRASRPLTDVSLRPEVPFLSEGLIFEGLMLVSE